VTLSAVVLRGRASRACKQTNKQTNKTSKHARNKHTAIKLSLTGRDISSRLVQQVLTELT